MFKLKHCMFDDGKAELTQQNFKISSFKHFDTTMDTSTI